MSAPRQAYRPRIRPRADDNLPGDVNRLPDRADEIQALIAAARLITKFSESEKEILRVLLRVNWKTARAALLSGKSVERVCNVGRKLTKSMQELTSPRTQKPTRFDLQEALRTLGRNVDVSLGDLLLKKVSRAPFKIKLQVALLLNESGSRK